MDKHHPVINNKEGFHKIYGEAGLSKIYFNFGKRKCKLFIWDEQAPLKQHFHDFYELIFIIGGSAMHEFDDVSYPISRGDIFVVHAGHKHGYYNNKNLRLANIIFTNEYFNQLNSEFCDLPGFNAFFVNEPIYRKNQNFKTKLTVSLRQMNEIESLLQMLSKETVKELVGSKSIQEKLFEIIVVEICRFYLYSTKSKPKNLINISKAIDLMENKLQNALTVPYLAKKMGMTESNFRYSFKKTTGLPPNDFLIQLRIKKAIDLMEKSDDVNINEISSKVGFDSAAYFIKQFKKRTGLTPYTYSKNKQ